jgi:hypothetical protein
MLPLIAFWSGLERAWGRKRMLVLYWFFHTLCAALAALPWMGIAVPALSRSRLGDELMKEFDLGWLAEIAAQAGTGAPAAAIVASGAAALILGLVAVCLSAGAVPLLALPESPYSPESFWRHAGRNFWPFLRLSLYSVVPYSAALALAGMLRSGAHALWGDGLEAAPLVWANHVRLVFLIVTAGLVSTAMDFAKVRLALSGSRQSLRACLGSLRLVWRHPGVMFWLWACFAIAQGLAAGLYVELAKRLEGGGVAAFVVLVILQQCYVMCRAGLRFAAWGAAAELDPILRPMPGADLIAPPPDQEPAPDYQI